MSLILKAEGMDEKYSVLAHNIKFLRKQKRLNQEELAASLSIKRSNIASYEAKNVEPRLRIILAMAKFFNVDLQTFLEERLAPEQSIPEFDAKSSSIENAEEFVTMNKNINTKEFVEKTSRIKKILLGFKTFHDFRKGKSTALPRENERILADIDNFTVLIDHLLVYNENMISELSVARSSKVTIDSR